MPLNNPCTKCEGNAPLDYNEFDEKNQKLTHVFKDGSRVECPNAEVSE